MASELEFAVEAGREAVVKAAPIVAKGAIAVAGPVFAAVATPEVLAGAAIAVTVYGGYKYYVYLRSPAEVSGNTTVNAEQKGDTSKTSTSEPQPELQKLPDPDEDPNDWKKWGAMAGLLGVYEKGVVEKSLLESGASKNAAHIGESAGGGGNVVHVDPSKLRWTQTTAGGRGRADTLRKSMSENGYNGPPIDVIQTQDGLATVDHTRAAVALELGIDSIPARVHLPSEPLPTSMIGRFGNASTWGEAAAYRAGNQRPPLGPTGTPTPPKLPKPSNRV
ncbi:MULTISPECIES: hypothetical protein [unclassified Asaia]|uniref:hypothetical protein n=1 Tax=unclassified Asaia TaxID=2685023 RepID=UPI000F8C9BE6|nr:hypothetical protein [Asaia sp. W19]